MHFLLVMYSLEVQQNKRILSKACNSNGHWYKFLVRDILVIRYKYEQNTSISKAPTLSTTPSGKNVVLSTEFVPNISTLKYSSS